MIRLSSRYEALAPSIIREMNGRKRPSSLDLSLGEPSLPPDPALLDRAWARLRAGPQGYTPNAGLPDLRAAIGAHHGLEGRSSAESVLVTVGSEEAVFVALMGTLDPGDEVLVPEPGYPAYRGIAQLVGAVPVPYPITRETGLVARLEVLQDKLTPRTRALVLNGPSNPFGTIDSEAELARIAAFAEAHAITVISDEIYGELYFDGSPPPSIARLTSRCILVSGLSKSCALTGLRLGYLVADPSFVRKATLAHQLLVTCAPRLAQYAALEIFSEPSRLRAHVPFYAEARTALLEAARALPKTAPLLLGPGAFYAIVDVAAHLDEGGTLAKAIALFEAEDLVVVPGVAFGPSGDWFWRVSYAAGAEAAREGIARIARFLGS